MKIFPALLAASCLPLLHADEAPAAKGTDFIRVHETDENAQLQTAVTRYEKNGVSVDLLGAVHIADKSYYDDLNKRFASYDALLFEMIGGENLVDGKQPAAAEGEDQANTDMQRLVAAFLSGNSNAIKLELVHTLGQGDDQIAAFAGNSVIIGDRNAKCLDVLGKQVKAGNKKIGIFYGAAHYPEMEQRLLKDGYKKTRQEWIPAWDIPKPKPQPAEAPEKKDAA